MLIIHFSGNPIEIVETKKFRNLRYAPCRSLRWYLDVLSHVVDEEDMILNRFNDSIDGYILFYLHTGACLLKLHVRNHSKFYRMQSLKHLLEYNILQFAVMNKRHVCNYQCQWYRVIVKGMSIITIFNVQVYWETREG